MACLSQSHQISAPELFSIFRATSGDFVSTLWKVFIDDSADGQQEKYMLAGALIGSKQAWHDFDKKWNRTLNKFPKIDYFHGKELSSLSKQFAQFRDRHKWPEKTGSVAANAKRDALRKVLEDSQLVAIGVGVLIEDYERVRKSHVLGRTHMAKDAFEWALQHVFLRSVLAIKQVDQKARIAFVSDISSKAPRYTELYANFTSKNPNISKHMLGIVHFDDEAWPGLQAADMVATAVKRTYDSSYEGGKINPDIALLSSSYQIHVVKEEYLIGVLDSQSEMKHSATKAV